MITHGNMIASIAGLQMQYDEVCKLNIELNIKPLQDLTGLYPGVNNDKMT